MECAMVQDNARNYAHCPPKKRPLSFYNAQADDHDDEQPQDLSIKRRRHEEDITPQASPAPPVPRSPSPRLPVAPPSPPRMPSLAEFYLKLFQSTALQQQQQQQQQQAEWWPSPVMWPLMPPAANPALATHPTLAANPSLAAHPSLAARLASPQPSEERLASPRSTASEDSGVGAESMSEDEIDVTSDSDACRRGSSEAAAGRGEARYSCTDCGKSYSTYSGLSKHKQFHCAALGAKSFACKHCEKVYTSLGALKMHIRTHTLPCKCQLCGKAFSRPWLLQGHIRTHTGEKPFQCPQCDRCFADRSNLRAHLQTHADVKKYACGTCHKTFSRMSLLNKHTEAACPARHSQQEQFAAQQ